ncbi:MAG TPA: MBL fold metallo-hydrolase [Anaerolineaceae bacterium]
MPAEIYSFICGPLGNNCYLVVDALNCVACVIDPSFDAEEIVDIAMAKGIVIEKILLTHAHFDHIAGVDAISAQFQPKVYLHLADLPLWREKGGAPFFNVHIDLKAEPDSIIKDQDILQVGNIMFHVLHTPGHTPGHVTYYLPENHCAFVGDLIFYHSVGRTDLPGASHAGLLNSIRNRILSLPPDTCLYCGHGPETSVAEEATQNPFL